MTLCQQSMQVIGDGGSPETLATVANADIWIDSVAGNDAGYGTQASPFKTIERFQRDYPPGMIIRHVIKLHLSGSFTSMPDVWDYAVTAVGQLVFDGSSAGGSGTVVAGPYTINTVTPVGLATDYGTSVATDVNVSGVTWTVNAYRGKFVRFTSGGWAGLYEEIWSNTSNTLRLGANWYGYAAGNTFVIVDPPCTITLDKSVTIANTFGEGQFDFLNTSLGIAGIAIVSNGHRLVIKGHRAVMSLAQLDNFAPANLIVNNCLINGSVINPGTFADPGLEDFFTYSLSIARAADGQPDLYLISSQVSSFVSPNYVRGSAGTGNTIAFAMIGGADFQTPATATMDNVFIDQIGFTDRCIVDFESSFLSLNGVWINSGGSAAPQREYIEARSKRVLLSWVKGNTAPAAYAASFGEGVKARVISNTRTTILGTTGAFKFFRTGSTPSATWPAAAGQVVSDLDGTRVYWL